MSDPSLTVSIPRPCNMPLGHGVTSTGSYGDLLRARVTRDEYIKIEEVAAQVGLSVSMFVRWCAYHAALALEKEHVGNVEPSQDT